MVTFQKKRGLYAMLLRIYRNYTVCGDTYISADQGSVVSKLMATLVKETLKFLT